MNTRIVSGGGLLLAVALFVAVNIVANQTLTAWRLDVTENRLFTLSPGTRNILVRLEEPITLRYYFSSRMFAGIPNLQTYGVRVRDLLEEYAANSNGRLKLTVIDPEPFSEAEDQAVAYGIRQLPITETGDMGYFGLVGTNTTDDEQVIPVFQPTREEALEYDLTKLIYNLAYPRKRVIGVLSGLPVSGGGVDPTTGGASPAWTFMSLLREVFEVRDVRRNETTIDKAIDTLLVIHPKELPEATRYAIDQFVVRGGRAMVFLDPLAEADVAMPDPENPGLIPSHASNMEDLLKAWGVSLDTSKVVGDLDAAIRVQYTGNRGPQEIEYLPWLRLGTANLDRDDFITNQLKQINVGSVGELKPIDGATTRLIPLLRTGPQTSTLEAEAVLFVRDPRGLLEGFKPEGRERVIAARVTGTVKSAFPNGRPKEKGTDAADPDFLAESRSPVSLILVADTDILSDRFWVQVQNYLGVRVPTPIADNADFLINALDNLGGNDDLISLRSRGKSSRPFTVVERIQREAEAQFRDQERALQQKLEETEKKIHELQQQKDQDSVALLSPEQKQAIDNFRAEQVATRKALRSVQHDLRRNIESLGTQLRLVNIGLIPALMGVIALGVGAIRTLRRRPAP
jgi:ABC-type uncharacterized transport system involved in gliding motility auxiliary subunit